MIYKIKEKFWNWGDDTFTIYDEHDKPCFVVEGEVFSWGDKLYVKDLNGQALALIDQKLVSWKPRYQIIIDGKQFAEVVQAFSWFKQKFTLDVPGPNDYTITGSFWKHDYEFVRNNQVVATVSKKRFSWVDSYSIDIIDGEDDLSILCTCIVIDQVLHDEDNLGAE